MGITTNPYYEDTDAPSGETVGYVEDTPDDVYFERDKMGMSGTLDTTGVGPGVHEDLRNVTDTFDQADARIADVLEASEVEPGDSYFVEGADPEATNADLAARLRGEDDSTITANPVTGEPGDGLEEAKEEREEAEQAAAERDAEQAAEVEKQRQEALDADALTDAQRQDPGVVAAEGDGDATKSPEEVVEGNVPDVKAFVEEHPDQAQAVGEAEAAKAEEEGRDERSGVTKAVEANTLYDPRDHKVGEVKEYFDAADDAEIERVKSVEATGQSRPGIMNYTKE